MSKNSFFTDEEWRRHRQHRRADGGAKVPYPSEEGAWLAISDMRAKHPGQFFESYACEECSRWHIANDHQARNRYWDTLRAEIGLRAAAHLGWENQGNTQHRVNVIERRGRKRRG